MEVGEMDGKEPQVEVPLVPATLIKPVPLKPVPIYTPGVINQMGYHANGAVACVEFSIGQEKLCRSDIRSDIGSDVARDSGKTGEHTASDASSSFSKLGFCEHLFAVEAESRNSSVTKGTNEGFNNPFVPSFILDNIQDPQETYIACCSNRISQDTPFTLDNADKESRQIASMQINMEENDPGGEERNGPASKLDSNVLPSSKELCDPIMEFAAISSPFKENQNQDKGSNLDTNLNKTPQPKPRRRKHRPKVIKEGKPKRTQKPVTPKPVQSKGNPTVKRKYVRKNALTKTSPTEVTSELTKEMPETAKTSCRRVINFDMGARDESSAGIENITALLGKENGMNVGLADDLNSSVKQASNSYTSIPEDTQAQNTCTSGRKGSGTKPAAKRKYVRRKGVSMTSAPAAEITKGMPQSTQMPCTEFRNFDEITRDQRCEVKEHATVCTGSEIGVIMQEMNAGLANYLNTSITQPTNDCMSLAEDSRALNTSSGRKCSVTEPEENSAVKKNTRKKVNSTSLTEVAGEMITENVPGSAQENPIIIPGSEIGVAMQDTNVGLAYDLNTDMKLASNSYVSLPEETQATNTSSRKKRSGTKPNENPTAKRKYVRKKRVKTSAPPIEVPGELTRENMSVSPIPSEITGLTETVIVHSNNMSWRPSKSDMGTRDVRYVRRENLHLHMGKENVVLEETKVGLKCNQDPWMNATLTNCNPLPDRMQQLGTSPGATHLSTSLSKYTHLGATAWDGNISNSQSSTMRLQMDGTKRKYSSSFSHADDSSMNLIGAHFNGLLSYKNSCYLQFPNIQKKRRTGKGKTSGTYNKSVTATKVQQAYPQKDALGHPYASRPSCWNYGSGYNTTAVPVISEFAENFIDNTKAFMLSLKRLEERSQTSNCGSGSPTRIRNGDTEPNYNTKQVRIPARETFRDAKRPQTCIDALIADTPTSLPKKKRNRKKKVISSSAHSSTNGMLHNFTLGKPSDVASEVLWKTMSYVDALTLQFRRLNINTEARDLALVLYKQPNRKQNSLIRGDGAIVPLQIKKQHLRPKVDLDDETDRVWKLLLLDINSPGIDGTDEDRAKWWEEERNVFRGRADSFIARMHLVQGDRRFSRWKGSVVDSVIGVFLTQNVSDHLSSSAFMSLAARFPKNLGSMYKAHQAEDTRLEPQVRVVEPEEGTEWNVKLLNQSVYDQSSLTTDIVERSAEKEAINSNDSCGTTSSAISLSDESNSRLSVSSQQNIKEQCSPMGSGLYCSTIEEGEEKSCDDDRKELIDIVSSQGSVISSQISGDFSNDQNPEKIGACSDSNSEVEVLSKTAKYNHYDSNTSFSKLLEMVSSTKFYEDNNQKSKSNQNLRDAYDQSLCRQHDTPKESLQKSSVTHGSSEASINLSHDCFDPFKTKSSSDFLMKKDDNGMNRSSSQTTEPASQVAITLSQTIVSQVHPQEQSNHQQQSFFNFNSPGQTQDLMQKERGSDLGKHKNATRIGANEISSAPLKVKTKVQGKVQKDDFNWDSLRIEAQAKAGKREKTENTMDSLDWDAVRCVDVNEIAKTIKERGMNNRLAERIQNFLNRLVEEHGSIDLEWLRDVPPDKAKEYLLSVKGLGLKSVECVRLLTLHHLAFPVDTNVGRIAVRLGWVPLQPLPETLQLHLLELYPVLESIQKYLWPRLCKLDQKTLYELHYQMITFGKVFCTKSKPNCNACPMRGECRHFASAFASARLALPGPEQKTIVSTVGNSVIDQKPSETISQLHLPPPENTTQGEEIQLTEVCRPLESKSEINICHPFIEEPTTPEPECSQVSQIDIEDTFYEDSCEIPTIKLNIEEFTLNLQNYMQEKMELQEGEMSKALVALNPEAASIPMPKLKNVSRLRTEHCVYELPDTHPLLQGWDTREPDDPGKYLLAIWTPGETANSIQPPESKCSSREEYGQLCNEKECFSCNSFREANSQIVRGTLLIPCRTAMRGSFPLNGTYFQVNEVFADHESSLNPISVPRSWIWNLNRRTVYFGTSVPTIFKGLTTQEIQQCFWRGYVCVRGFDRETRAPRPLMARLHFPASKLAKTKEKNLKGSTSAKSRGMKSNVEQPELISNSSNF
ncbi:DNA glycosylase/AP lyase ROS1-like [Vigna umbellata]|uniref:DNA glycosylase/AP lyase ROS1-like n=1 Tax=Vigna umbellata TaxID=87088 RepID=UPI001F5F2E67|nr:DNA glycosylase/AP lyase ROS1-like [Vigna umbellata]